MYKVQKFEIDSPLIIDFKEFKSGLYRDDPFYIRSEEHFSTDREATFFMAKENETILARACAIINPDINYQNYTCGLTGYFECINNIEVAKVLFNSVIDYLKQKGCNYVIGPLNGSTWHKYRVTRPGNNKPFFLDNYNKPWYCDLFTSNSFEIIANYSSTITSTPSFSGTRLEKFENYFSKKGIVIRNMNMSDFKNELERIYEVSIKSFSNNFLYSPVSFDDFYSLYKDINRFMVPEFSLIAENDSGQPCGFIFAINNIFDKTKKTLIIKTVAVIPERYYKGLGSFLTEKIHKLAYDNNYQNIIHALMHENNISRNVLSHKSIPYQSYVLYGRAI